LEDIEEEKVSQWNRDKLVPNPLHSSGSGTKVFANPLHSSRWSMSTTIDEEVASVILKNNQEMNDGNAIESDWEDVHESSQGQYSIHFGQTFDNFETAKETIFKEAAANSVLPVVRNSLFWTDEEKNVDRERFPYQFVQFCCTHGGKPYKAKGRNIRPHQTTTKVDCPFTIWLRYSKKKKCYKITQFHKKHANHKVSKKDYMAHPLVSSLNKAEKEEYVGKLINDLGVKKGKVKDLIRKDTGKMPSTQHLYNYQRRMSKNDGMTDLEEVKTMMEERHKNDPGSNLRIIYRKDDFVQLKSENNQQTTTRVLKVIFWQTSEQARLIKKYSSPLFLDGTYNLTNQV
jgi:hypothetical protein